MFVWRTCDILGQFQAHLPAHLEVLKPVIDEVHGPNFEGAFARLQPISVDFAILEKARKIHAVIPRIEWDDVGGWMAAAKYLDAGGEGNAIRGRVHCHRSEDNTVFVEQEGEEILLLGVKDLVVVRSEGRTLVSHKDSLDHLKEALARMKE